MQRPVTSCRPAQRAGSSGARPPAQDGVVSRGRGRCSQTAERLGAAGRPGPERGPGSGIGGGRPFESCAAGPGSRLPRPAGINSRLHAATRAGLGSAGEKQRLGRAGEAEGRTAGAGPATWGWAGAGGVAPDLGAQEVLGRILVKRERAWFPKFSLKLRVHWGVTLPEALVPKAKGYRGIPPSSSSTVK